MGANKALLEVGGCAILRRTVALLRPLVNDLFLVADDAAPYAGLGLPVLPDVLSGRGALGGIHAALMQAARPRVLCVACDMPFIEPGILALLLGSDAGEDALVPRVGGHPEPLLAVYRRSALPAIERALAAGRLRVVDGLEGLRVRYIEEGEIASVDPAGRCFVNVNTPGELAAARAAVDEGRT
jgi:molybdopterin-guanine dinucleotide biosynthesis protein A